MDQQEIINRVRSYIQQSLGGADKENRKFDFKYKWPNLKDIKDINEFLKDTCAIVNTFGKDGFLVYGFDDKTKKFNPSTFSDSNLKDTNELQGVINRRVDRLFDIDLHDVTIDGNKLSILHIPSSLDKPHVITNYQTFDSKGNLKNERQHATFVRRGTTTDYATRYDLELMEYDRKNIVKEYDIRVCLLKRSKTFKLRKQYGFINFQFYPTIENLGRRPIAISKLHTRVYQDEEDIGSKTLGYDFTTTYSASQIIVKPGEIWNNSIMMSCNIGVPEVVNNLNAHSYHDPLQITLSTGKILTVEIEWLD